MQDDNLIFFEHRPIKKPISILGVPMDIGKDSAGTDIGPAYLRASGLISMLKEIEPSFIDLGDVKCPGREEVMDDIKAKYVEPIAKTLNEVAEKIKDETLKGRFSIVLGGDHSVAIGAISGAASALKDDLGLIYIDAHPDANTNENTLSGNVHGMVTTALAGVGHPLLTKIGNTKPKIKPGNLLFVGIKDFDQAEIDWIRQEKIPAFTPIDIEQHGLGKLCEAIDDLQKRVKNIWVSFDIDSVDQQFAPATPMSTAGGLTYRELYALSKFIGHTCNLTGFDIVECMPTGDVSNKTAFGAVTFAANLLGAEYSWYTAYMEEEKKKQRERESKAQ